jgi:cytochrome c553
MRSLVIRALALFTGSLATLLGEPANESIFQLKLQPVLQKHCASCHSPETRQGGFSVDSLQEIVAGGKHGAAIVPGNSQGSLLMQYVLGEKSPKMPLGGSLPDADIATLRAAIDAMKSSAGASEPVADPHVEWLRTKPEAQSTPAVRNKDWVKNPIDAFVLSRLESEGLMPAPPANRRALIRRVYFDLIGLPPTPEQTEEFVNSTAPDAYNQVIEKLLASERYGERWGRHWLDLARFAESDGFAIDGERPTAWRYRDYVIRSFNNDKPYDQFVIEQIAGDEAGDRGASDARSDRLVALGFLRMATWEADANFKTQLRQDFLNEITGTTSSVFLGLTAGCARCHDHKYDPIPQRDFYRLQAFFAATRVDERPAPFNQVEDPKKMRQLFRRFEDEAEAAGEVVKNLEEELKQKYLKAHNLQPGDKKAEQFQKALNDKKDTTYTAEEREAIKKARLALRRASEASLRYRPVAYSVADVTPPHVPSLPDTFVLSGGDLGNKGEKVEPGFLELITGSQNAASIPFAGGSSGRRRALAEWIASAENPLTSRVMVNRIWKHHFGEGIVRTPGDFGKNGERPSHPELLDWLAVQFIEKKWSIKEMHRLMLTSNTYQQSTAHPEWKKYSESDPSNRLLWRMNWLRLESEILRDSILAISGRLRTEAGGPGMFFDVPNDVAEGFEFFKWFPSDEQQQLRRTIYAFQRRSVMMPMMEVFDGANMSESCSRRNVTTVAPQAFTLLNGQLTRREASHFAARVVELAGPDPKKQIEKAFMLALSRPPAADETERAHALFQNTPALDALARLGSVLFNLNEFIYLE